MVIELISCIAPRLKAYFMNLLQKRIQLLSWVFYFDILFNPSCRSKINPSCILKMQGETVSKRFQPYPNQLYFCSDFLKEACMYTQCFLKVLQKRIEFQSFVLQILHL